MILGSNQHAWGKKSTRYKYFIRFYDKTGNCLLLKELFDQGRLMKQEKEGEIDSDNLDEEKVAAIDETLEKKLLPQPYTNNF